MKRFILLIICILFLASCSRGNSDPTKSTESEIIEDTKYTYELDNDGYILISISKKDIEELSIPDTYNGKNVIGIRVGTLDSCVNLKKINLPSKLEFISNELFKYTKIEYNEYENGKYLGSENSPFLYLLSYDGIEASIHQDTRLIGDNVFNNSKLESITFNDKLYGIGNKAFYNNDKLYTITLPQSLKKIASDAFMDCDNIFEVINLSSLNVTLEESTNGYVAYNARIVSVENKPVISKDENFVYMVLEDTKYILKYINTAKTATIPDDVSIIAKRAFSETSIEEISLNKVKILEDYSFSDAKSLKKVITNNTLEKIGDSAFLNDTTLMELVLGTKVNKVGADAFKGCANLTYVYYDGNVKSWTDIDFTYSSLEELYSNPMVYSKYVFFLDGEEYKEVINITIPSSVTEIKNCQFMNFSKLENVNFEGSMETIGEYAFKGCSRLNEMHLPTGLSSLEYGLFEGCTSLKKLYFDKSVNKINNIFVNTNLKLDNIYFKGDTEDWVGIVYVDYYSSIVEYSDEISFFKNDNYYLPAEIHLGDEVTKIPNYAFKGFKQLKKVYLTGYLTTIGANAFLNTEIEEVYFDSNIDTWVKIRFSDYSSNPIHKGAKLYLPNGVGEYYEAKTNVKITNVTISYYAFYNSKISSIILANSVKNINHKAFYGCTQLINVYYEGTLEEYNAMNIDLEESRLAELHIYYYSENEPLTSGYYWHYNNTTPEKW